jgi:hypothetical protein
MRMMNDEDLVLDLQASVNNFNSFYVELCKLMTTSKGVGASFVDDDQQILSQ